MSVLKFMTYIITSITAGPMGLCDTSDDVCLDLHNCCYSIFNGLNSSSNMYVYLVG